MDITDSSIRTPTSKKISFNTFFNLKTGIKRTIKNPKIYLKIFLITVPPLPFPSGVRPWDAREVHVKNINVKINLPKLKSKNPKNYMITCNVVSTILGFCNIFSIFLIFFFECSNENMYGFMVYTAGLSECVRYWVYCHSFVLICEKLGSVEVHHSVIIPLLFTLIRSYEVYCPVILSLFTSSLVHYNILGVNCTVKLIGANLCPRFSRNFYNLNTEKSICAICTSGVFSTIIILWWDSHMRFNDKMSKVHIFRVYSFSPIVERQIAWTVAPSGGHREFIWWIIMVSWIFYFFSIWRRL